MNNQFVARDYVEKVISYVTADKRTLDRLTDDLYRHIEEAAEREPIEAIISKMGDPRDMAGELMDAIYQDKESVVRELVKAKTELRREGGFEYKSKRRLFGLPLVHINMSAGRGFRRIRVAKGIIAIGDIACGVLALGGLAFGGITLGGVCIGLVGLGGVALGLALAIGGAAVGMFAAGGLAVGMYAFGGCAIASRVAVGGFAKATVAIGGQAEGLYTLVTGGTSGSASLDISMISAKEVRELIMQAYPRTWEVIIRVMTFFFY